MPGFAESVAKAMGNPSMDQQRMELLQNEAAYAPNDPGAQEALQKASGGFAASIQNAMKITGEALKTAAVNDPSIPQYRGDSEPPKTSLMDYIKQTLTGAGQTLLGIVAPTSGEGRQLSRDLMGAAEAGLSMATASVAAPVGAVMGVARGVMNGYGTREGAKIADDRAREIAETLTYQPRLDTGKSILGAAGKAAEAAKLAPIGPSEGIALASIASMPKGKPPAPPVRPGGQFGSVGVTQPNQIRAMIQTATPDLQRVVDQSLKAGAQINGEVLGRHVQADSLPVPVRLTRGQATRDIALLSEEQNMRGKQKALAERFNEQNKALIDNIDAIKEKAGPDVFAVDKTEIGDQLIDAYRRKDAALNDVIRARYKALEDANGGNFPIDGKAFVNLAEQQLHKKLLADHVPAEYKNLMSRLREGQPMTFENFESLRTNLARTQRTSQDGNARAAAGVIRDALEEMPMPEGAANLKPLADAARSAAKARFDLLKKDPAFKAVVEGRASADHFIEKYIVKPDRKHLEAMRENLADDPVALQSIGVGAIYYLKQAAGVRDGGNFSQAGYNKALGGLRPKLQIIFDPETRKYVETLGNVARYTQEQPRGSYVNNSNTLVGALAEGTKTAAENAANVAAKGVPVGSFIRKIGEKRAQQRMLNETLEPAAGIKIKDIK